MGEIADMMLDGVLCAGCGAAIDGEESGYPRYCSKRCAGEHDAANEHRMQVKVVRGQANKVPCPTCGRKVKAVGLADHQRDAHGAQRERESV